MSRWLAHDGGVHWPVSGKFISEGAYVVQGCFQLEAQVFCTFFICFARCKYRISPYHGPAPKRYRHNESVPGVQHTAARDRNGRGKYRCAGKPGERNGAITGAHARPTRSIRRDAHTFPSAKALQERSESIRPAARRGACDSADPEIFDGARYQAPVGMRGDQHVEWFSGLPAHWHHGEPVVPERNYNRRPALPCFMNHGFIFRRPVGRRFERVHHTRDGACSDALHKCRAADLFRKCAQIPPCSLHSMGRQ